MQKKRRRNIPWITVVIHNALYGGTVILPHHLEYCLKNIKKKWKNYVGKHRSNPQYLIRSIFKK
jgi:hypothetical protein